MRGVKLGRHSLEKPIIQGGMGIGISLGGLAGAVACEGGMGVISAAQPGYLAAGFKTDVLKHNIEALKAEVNKARSVAKGKGMLGVNVMVAGNTYANMIQACVEARVDAIISGAGLPLDLPGLVAGSDILVAPIVSSGKALTLIGKAWKKRYDRLPDFVVCEGPLAGGHLGFSKQSLVDGTAQSLEEILADVLEVISTWESKIPVFVAGGIFDGYDIARMLKLGASGVQMGTRFIATEECDAALAFKQAFVDAKAEDIELVVSPAQLPGRAIMSDFMKAVMNDTPQKVTHCYQCLHKCNPATTPYCISQALMDAACGDVANGLVFSGSNGYRIQSIETVKSVMESCMKEVEEVQ